ncbi:hypothetical protein ACOMHN_007931 [Nucella lapillus]
MLDTQDKGQDVRHSRCETLKTKDKIREATLSCPPSAQKLSLNLTTDDVAPQGKPHCRVHPPHRSCP